jgi:hypothetical protein
MMLSISDLQNIIKSQEKEWRKWEAVYRECQQYVNPYMGRFNIAGYDNKDRTKEKPRYATEPTPLQAAKVMAAGLQAGTTSRTRPWFKIQTDDPELNQVPAVAEWIHEVSKRMYTTLDQSNYYAVTQAQYMELGIFGTAAMSIMPKKGGGITCHSYTAGEYMISLDEYYMPSVFSRKYWMTVRQVVEEFGYDNCSKRVQALYGKKDGTDPVDRDKKIEICHVIMPRREVDPTKLDKLNMPWASFKFEWGNSANPNAAGFEDYKKEIGAFLSVGGYRERPVMTPRWSVNSDESYGISPAIEKMGRIRLLHKLDTKAVKGFDKLVDPPLTAPFSAKNRQFMNTVGLPNSVAFTQAGEKIEQQYAVNWDVQSAEYKLDLLKNEIKEGFYNPLFTALMNSMDDPSKTATEVTLIDQERLAMLGPVLEILHKEQIGPTIDRVFQIMNDNGELPEPPEEIKTANLTIEYTSVVAQEMKAQNVTNQERVLGVLGNMAGINPEVLDNYDFDEGFKDYARNMGIEPDQIKDPEEVAAVRQNRAQQQQAAMMAEAMPAMAQGAKTLSETDVSREDSALNALIGG